MDRILELRNKKMAAIDYVIKNNLETKTQKQLMRTAAIINDRFGLSADSFIRAYHNFMNFNKVDKKLKNQTCKTLPSKRSDTLKQLYQDVRFDHYKQRRTATRKIESDANYLNANGMAALMYKFLFDPSAKGRITQFCLDNNINYEDLNEQLHELTEKGQLMGIKIFDIYDNTKIDFDVFHKFCRSRFDTTKDKCTFYNGNPSKWKHVLFSEKSGLLIDRYNRIAQYIERALRRIGNITEIHEFVPRTHPSKRVYIDLAQAERMRTAHRMLAEQGRTMRAGGPINNQ